jgi:hypothetical protein
MTASSEDFPVLKPDPQVSFYYRLLALEELYLHDASSRTVAEIRIELLDHELARYVSVEHLSRVASFGLRGEVFFPVPCLIRSEPYLLGYYRLLLGFSQKEFYNKGPFGRFKRLEERGEIPDRVVSNIDSLCKSMVQSAANLQRPVTFSIWTRSRMPPRRSTSISASFLVLCWASVSDTTLAFSSLPIPLDHT